MKEKRAFAILAVGFVFLAVLMVVVGGAGLYGIASGGSNMDSLYDQNITASRGIRDVHRNLQDQLAIQRELVVYAGNGVKIQALQEELSCLEEEMDWHFSLYESTVFDYAEEQEYFNAKHLYLNEYSDIKTQMRQAGLTGFDEAVHLFADPRAKMVETEMLNYFDYCIAINDEWAEERVYQNSQNAATLMIIITAAMVISAGIAFIFFIVSLVLFIKK